MKNKLCSTVAATLLLTAGLLAGNAAMAADTLTFDAGGNAVFGATHATAGIYTDEYLFSVDPETLGWAIGTAVVGKTLPSMSDNYAITGISFFQVNSDSSHTALPSVFTGGSSVEFYPTNGLGTGSYGFDITGTTLASAKGAYGGTLNLVTAPVPEPATYAMVLIGLGLLGFTAQRQRNDKLG